MTCSAGLFALIYTISLLLIQNTIANRNRISVIKWYLHSKAIQSLAKLHVALTGTEVNLHNKSILRGKTGQAIFFLKLLKAFQFKNVTIIQISVIKVSIVFADDTIVTIKS